LGIGESRGKSGRACIDHKAAPVTDHCDGTEGPGT
jgi:hypothetical protein